MTSPDQLPGISETSIGSFQEDEDQLAAIAAAKGLFPEFSSAGKEYAPGEAPKVNQYLEPLEVQIRDTYIQELEQKNALLSDRANRDHLTGLANRSVLESTYDKLQRSQFDHEVESHSRTVSPPTHLLVVDADDFAQINKQAGHPGGDELLKLIAQRLGEAVRERDVVARLGDRADEFAVLLPRTTSEQAKEVAERVRKGVEMIDRLGGTKVKPSVSIGVESVDFHLTLEDNIKVVDAALYTAKELGKNKVVMASEIGTLLQTTNPAAGPSKD
jgi:diguanylate cyclase (GGDEF)-like protein